MKAPVFALVVLATFFAGLPIAAQQSNPATAKESDTAAAQKPILTIPQNPYPYRPLNFYLIKRELDQYFKELRYKSPTYFNSEATGFAEYQLWVNTWERRVYPTGGDLELAQGTITNYIERRLGLGLPARKSVGLSIKKNPAGGNWIELGPSSSPASWHGSTEFISFDPQNANTILTGSPVGGLFYSDNSGATWSPGGMDFQQGSDSPPLTSASHCIVNPTDSNTWFCATGDNGSNPILANGRYGTGWNQSFGIFRTMDRGVTWHYVGLFNSYWGWEIYELLADPTDPNGNVIYAATVAGLYKTTNAMDPNPANVTWTQLPVASNPTQEVYHVDFQPGSSSMTLYASGNITDSNSNRVIVQSTDAGTSWTSLMPVGGFPANTLVVGMAVTPANPNLVYAVAAIADPTNSYLTNEELYRFDASTNLWTDKGPVNNTGTLGLRATQSIGASPTDAGLVYLGEVYPAYCDHADQSGFCNWVQACGCLDTGGNLHTDMHKLGFSPNGTTVWAATDGGVFSSSPRSTTWSDQNNGLGVSTIRGMATGANDPGTLLIGMYDDGTEYSSNHGSTWTYATPGFLADGGWTIVNYLDSSNMYGTDINNGPGLFITDDGWRTYNYRFPPNAATWALFSVLGGNGVLNPLDPPYLYATGGSEVFRSHNEGQSWTQISSFGLYLAYGVWRQDPSASYLAAPNPNYLDALLLDSKLTPTLWQTKDAQGSSPTFTQIPEQAPVGVCPPNCWPNAVALDPSDPDIFTLTNNVFTSGGVPLPAQQLVVNYNPNNPQPWTNWTLNLPTVNISSVMYEAGTNGNVYVGTYGGEVYVLNNSLLANGTNWVLLGTGLAHSNVTFLDINYVTNKLRAGTFGRGMWETSLLCPDATDLTFSGAQGAGWYEATNDISSTAQVSGQVTYRAGNQITLGDGFSVTAGAGTQYRALIRAL
jgi:hypothetical protein